MNNWFRIVFESIPLFLAFIAILACGKKALITHSPVVRWSNVLAVVCAILMIAAQVSWSWTLFIQNDLIGTELSNIMWTTFNTLVMIKFIYAAHWRDA